MLNYQRVMSVFATHHPEDSWWMTRKILCTESVDPSWQVLFCGYLAWKYIPMCAAHWMSQDFIWMTVHESSFFCLKPGNFQTYQLIFFPTRRIMKLSDWKSRLWKELVPSLYEYIYIILYNYIYVHLMMLNRMVMGLNCQENPSI